MKRKITYLFTIMLVSVSSVFAQSNTGNAFGLVYEGAIKENLPGKVNIHPVKYKLNGNEIAANVYTPANYDPAKKYPAITVAHPNGGIKEQVAGLYGNVWQN